MTILEKWEALENLGVTEQTLQIITRINGYNDETLENVLFAYAGLRSFEQLEEEV